VRSTLIESNGNDCKYPAADRCGCPGVQTSRPSRSIGDEKASSMTAATPRSLPDIQTRTYLRCDRAKVGKASPKYVSRFRVPRLISGTRQSALARPSSRPPSSVPAERQGDSGSYCHRARREHHFSPKAVDAIGPTSKNHRGPSKHFRFQGTKTV
jgi:hypothetical protein